jgi:hypothetical protein
MYGRSESHWFQIPRQPERFFGDDVGHFFWEEEFSALQAADSTRMRQSVVEPIGPFCVECFVIGDTHVA